jgi:TatD DNase family protein
MIERASTRPGTIAYELGDALYLNLTSRCPNDCVFCARRDDFRLWGYDLRLAREPEVAEVIAAIGDPRDYDEVVFCGFGEPTLRADLVSGAARWLKERGARRVRLNTNGLADRVAGRDVLADLAGVLDAVSVSLNAQDAATYDRLCRPTVPDAYAAVLAFLERAPRFIPEVTATIVDVPGVDEEACRRIADSLGARFHVRGRRR